MGISYRIDGQKGITYVVWDGVITAEDFLTHVWRLVKDDNWPPFRRLQIIDLLNASLDASIDVNVLQTGAGIYAAHAEKIANAKVAVVASAVFRQASVFEGHLATSPISMIVFNSLETACSWLGIDVAQTRAVLRELRLQQRQQAKPYLPF